MTPTAEKVKAAQLVGECLAEIKQARLAAADATGRKAQALAESRTADQERQEAAEAKARGEPNAGKRLDEAHAAWLDALTRLDRAQLEDEGALRAIRSAEARLSRVRKAHLPELAQDIEREQIAAVEAAVEGFVPAVLAYVSAFNKAAGAYRALGPATQAAILGDDDARGRLRDPTSVMEDATVPDCPLEPSIVRALRSVMPRPRFFDSAYTPSVDDGIEVTTHT